MTKLTRAQRVALKQVYGRTPIYLTPDNAIRCALARDQAPMTYRQFRKLAEPTFGLDGAVVVPWVGMFLLIEADGYTHS